MAVINLERLDEIGAKAALTGLIFVLRDVVQSTTANASPARADLLDRLIKATQNSSMSWADVYTDEAVRDVLVAIIEAAFED